MTPEDAIDKLEGKVHSEIPLVTGSTVEVKYKKERKPRAKKALEHIDCPLCRNPECNTGSICLKTTTPQDPTFLRVLVIVSVIVTGALLVVWYGDNQYTAGMKHRDVAINAELEGISK